KARSPETSLNQQEIANLTDISLSTVSRTLTKMVKAGFCDFVGKMNEKGRLEKKFFTKKSVNYVIIERFKLSIKESSIIGANFGKLKENISKKQNANPHLINLLETQKEDFELLARFYEKMVREAEEAFLKSF
ncbi:MAG: MarR family transcriptional regulator, partial [Candidatus Hodarchaeota archaeon]